MTDTLLKLTTAAAIALMPFAAWSQTSGKYQREAPTATQQDRGLNASPKMGRFSEIQKQTNALKNGTDQSESVHGMNKNGQLQR